METTDADGAIFFQTMSFTLTTEETAALQAALKSQGARLGDFGPRGDGVDGKGGELTRAEFRRYFAKYFRPEFAPRTETPATPAVKPGPEPSWMIEARRWIGLSEIPGPKHHRQIIAWWQAILAPFRDDETPWCAGFVGGVLETMGLRSTRSAAARSYSKSEDFIKLKQPAQGAITVFWRGSPDGWQGHVAFLAGVSDTGDPWCVGGNQSDAVTLAKFSKARLVGYYWPRAATERPENFPVRRLTAAGAYSKNEA